MQLQEVEQILSQRILSGQYPAQERMPSLREVAQELGASYVTVQKALSVLQEKGFLRIERGRGAFVTRRGMGRELTALGAKEILYLFADPEDNDPEEYELELYRNVQGLVRERGYLDRIVLPAEAGGMGEADWRRVAGAIVTHDCLLARKLARRHVPLVFSTSIPVESGAHSVNPNFYEGCGLVTRHLLERGHRKIGFVTTAARDAGTLLTFAGRYQGYAGAMAEAGLPPGEPLPWRRLSQEAHVVRGAKSGLTAFVVANDVMAVEVLDVLKTAGFRVPEQISLVGLEDMRCSRSSCPPLTTAGYSKRELARVSVELLFQAMEQEASGAVRRLIPMTLIERDSVRPLSTKKGGRS